MTTSSILPPENCRPVFAPLSVTAVEHTGWRVVYADADGSSTVPVVAWGVFGLTWVSLETDETVRDDGTVIEALVPTTSHPDGGYVHLGPAWNENFVSYLPPGAPDPQG